MIKDSGKYFYVSDGTVLRSLAEFEKALEKMSAETYDYHMQRGDFAKWVEEVLKKKTLAKNLSGASRTAAKKALKAKK
jgi:hypothetical protein